MARRPAEVKVREESALIHFTSSDEDLRMKGFIAACIAVGILWGVDVEVNDGRYSAVVKQVITSILPR
jgi:hypothetical protein